MTDRLSEDIDTNIARHGLSCQSIAGDADWPPFAYTIGWGITRNWPETLIVGAARAQLAHEMLWRLWDSNTRPVAGTTRADILVGFDCELRSVHRSWFAELFGRAVDTYRSRGLPPFEAVQCVWPTTSGVMPWDSNASAAFARRQPVVDRPMKQAPMN